MNLNHAYEGKRIILADADNAQRQTNGTFLRRNGFHVTFAHDGFEVLNLIEQDDYDLLILSEKMGPMGGIETLSLVRDHKPKKELPAIMIGMQKNQAVIQECIRLEASGFLLRPVKFNVLLDKIISAFESVLKNKK